jgi:hypothetical protein
MPLEALEAYRQRRNTEHHATVDQDLQTPPDVVPVAVVWYVRCTRPTLL